MALAFGGNTILGTHNLKAGPWDYQRQGLTIFGVIGEASMFGERTTRQIVVESLIHDAAGTQAQLEQYILDMEARAGEVGDLVETGNMERTFENCEFERFEQDPNVGPLPPSGNITSWWTQGRLFFRQLQPNQ